MKEVKYQVEDALNATKAAVAEGVVAGGASTLLRAAKELDKLLKETKDEDEKVGVNIIKKALQNPFRTIAKNSGIYDISLLVVDIEKNGNSGFDFNKMIAVADMIAAGIIDPALVLKQAISNSASIAGSVITTEVVITSEPKKDDNSSGGMPNMAGMDGMGMM